MLSEAALNRMSWGIAGLRSISLVRFPAYPADGAAQQRHRAAAADIDRREQLRLAEEERRATSSCLPHDLVDRAMPLLDRDVGVGAHAGVGVGDSDISGTLTAEHVRHFLRRRVAIDEAVVLGRVAVRPAIDGDAFDVTCRIETGAAKHSSQLIADVSLESL